MNVELPLEFQKPMRSIERYPLLTADQNNPNLTTLRRKGKFGVACRSTVGLTR